MKNVFKIALVSCLCICSGPLFSMMNKELSDEKRITLDDQPHRIQQPLSLRALALQRVSTQPISLPEELARVATLLKTSATPYQALFTAIKRLLKQEEGPEVYIDDVITLCNICWKSSGDVREFSIEDVELVVRFLCICKGDLSEILLFLANISRYKALPHELIDEVVRTRHIARDFVIDTFKEFRREKLVIYAKILLKMGMPVNCCVRAVQGCWFGTVKQAKPPHKPVNAYRLEYAPLLPHLVNYYAQSLVRGVDDIIFLSDPTDKIIFYELIELLLQKGANPNDVNVIWKHDKLTYGGYEDESPQLEEVCTWNHEKRMLEPMNRDSLKDSVREGMPLLIAYFVQFGEFNNNDLILPNIDFIKLIFKHGYDINVTLLGANVIQCLEKIITKLREREIAPEKIAVFEDILIWLKLQNEAKSQTESNVLRPPSSVSQ